MARAAGPATDLFRDLPGAIATQRSTVFNLLKHRLRDSAETKGLLAYLDRYPGLDRILLTDPQVKALIENGKELSDLAALRERLDGAIKRDLKQRQAKRGKDYLPPAEIAAPDFLPHEKDAMRVRPSRIFHGVWRPDPPGPHIDAMELPGNLGTCPAARPNMLKAGKNGNPAFEIAAHTGNNALGYCQMTLVKADLRGCLGATADHCVRTRSGRKTAHFQTAYGRIIAIEVKALAPFQTVATDMATVRFAGPTCETMVAEKVPVLGIATSPPKKGDVVLAGVRFFGKLLAGTIAAQEAGAATIDVDVASVDDSRHEGGIHSGDSGGPLLRYAPEKRAWELAGILSASTIDSQAHYDTEGEATVGGLEGFYATDLELLRQETEKEPNPLP